MPKFYALAVSLALTSALAAQCPELVWSDEFDGDTLNLDYWTHEIGDGCDRNLCGWGNSELQYYQPENTTVSDGILTITARVESIGTGSYTSSRIISRNKQDFRYGRMEARIKVPAGRGTWPAFWMLPTDEVYGFWPQSGEIDIMEYVGHEPDQVLGTIHFGQPSPNNSFTGSSIDLREPVADEFHDFAVEWEEDEIRWLVDGVRYGTKTPADLNGERWPFDQDFFFILNLAVGGTLGGPVNPSAFPATMQVDYVRVYGGNRPFITGERQVANAATGVSYTIGNLPEETGVSWTVPEGATIVSGQGTSTLTVDWASSGGRVTADPDLACDSLIYSLDVIVDPAIVYQSSLENFDEEGELEFEFATGTLTEVDNPDPDTINATARVGSYARAGGSLFDVLVYNVSSISDAGVFSEGERRFFIDLWTDAPVGTTVLLQLETGAAEGGNYPVGRHSRYQSTTKVQNGWERIYLPFLDRPDSAAPDDAVTSLILLFAPNTQTANTYIFDNLDIYGEATTSLFSPSFNRLTVSASPNPVNEKLRLSFSPELTGDVQLEVFSRDGRLVSTRRLDDEEADIGIVDVEVRNLPIGVYYARIRTGSRSGTVRFAKQ